MVLDEVGLPEYMNAQQIGRMMAGIFTRWQPEVYAGYLRRLYEDPAYYDRLAKNGKAKINEVLGAQTITALLKERLAPILQAADDAQADRA